MLILLGVVYAGLLTLSRLADRKKGFVWAILSRATYFIEIQRRIVAEGADCSQFNKAIVHTAFDGFIPFATVWGWGGIRGGKKDEISDNCEES